MSAEDTLFIIAQWVEKAEHDLIAAVHLLKMKAACPPEIVCFHAQQCVEKYLKALLIFERKEVERTHSIQTLMLQVPFNMRPDLSPEEQVLLTDYAVSNRYPGDFETISLTTARKAVRIARRVRMHVRELLPKIPLKR